MMSVSLRPWVLNSFHFLIFSFILNLLHFLVHFFHYLEGLSNPAYFDWKEMYSLDDSYLFTKSLSDQGDRIPASVVTGPTLGCRNREKECVHWARNCTSRVNRYWDRTTEERWERMKRTTEERKEERRDEREENPPPLRPRRVYWQNACMLNTCARFAGTHGGVLNRHTETFWTYTHPNTQPNTDNTQQYTTTPRHKTHIPLTLWAQTPHTLNTHAQHRTRHIHIPSHHPHTKFQHMKKWMLVYVHGGQPTMIVHSIKIWYSSNLFHFPDLLFWHQKSVIFVIWCGTIVLELLNSIV